MELVDTAGPVNSLSGGEPAVSVHELVSANCLVISMAYRKTVLPYWPFVRGIHRWSVDSPHKGQAILMQFGYYSLALGHSYIGASTQLACRPHGHFGGTILVSCIYTHTHIKSLQLIWRSGIHIFQMSCSELIRMNGYPDNSPSIDHQTTYPIGKQRHEVFNNSDTKSAILSSLFQPSHVSRKITTFHTNDNNTIASCYNHRVWHLCITWWRHQMDVIGPLCKEFTGHRWIPITKASDAELWYFLWCAPEQTVE